MQTRNEWAIVLAAGDGTRLSVLTDEEGAPVPKQFWSLHGSRSLLGDALQRAFQVVSRRRTVVVVAEKHRAFWEAELEKVPAENVIVQPANRGTAPGLLLPLLSILRRDPEARVVVLPSDHFVAKEYVLGVSLRLALESLGRDADRLVLLGITPTAAETGYGWIVPRRGVGSLHRVAAFVEKPRQETASDLMASGGLWNSFLMVARGGILLDLYRRLLPDLVEALVQALASPDPEALPRLYETLEPSDFSRDLLQGSEGDLWLLPVPECGWTDLGTPQRLAECVTELEARTRPPRVPRSPSRSARFSLTEALRRFGLGDPATRFNVA